MTDLPPDRAHLATEGRNPRSRDLHRLDLEAIVRVIQDEDRSVPLAMERARPALVAFIAAAEPGFIGGGRLIYVGAGTSGRLGVLDASEAPPTFQVDPGRIVGLIAGGDSALRKSSEDKEDDPRGAEADLTALALSARDSVLGIAAGGTTAYVLGAIAFAKRLPAPPLTGLLSCSPVPKPAGTDHLIVVDTGPEVITGSTRMKAGTATKLALNAISTSLMVRAGKVYENLMVDLRASNAKLRDRAARIVGDLTGLGRPACFALLDQAGGSAKIAVAMQRLRLDRASAEERLASNAGHLGRLLDHPRPSNR